MRKAPPHHLLLLLFLASSCAVQHSYFLSPLDINSNYYHTIPTRSDSTKAAIYGSLALFGGTANYQSRDNLYAFQGEIHRSHNFGHFQAYYGLGLFLGSYHVASYVLNYYRGFPIRDTIIPILAESHQFFGAYGFNGGINLVLPLPRGGEWRVIGLETFIGKEFGDYLKLRKSFSDSAIDILATDPSTKTLGVTTEFVWKRRTGTEIGYKISLGGSFISSTSYQGTSSSELPFYFSHTIHFTKGNTTAFWQINFGTHSDTFQTGLNYQLGGRPKRKPRSD